LDHAGHLEQFSAELAREWAIETGQIEGIYHIDRGVTATLIERGIDADFIPQADNQSPPELIAAIIRDHLEVLDGLFQFVKGERQLSKSYINEIHSATSDTPFNFRTPELGFTVRREAYEKAASLLLGLRNGAPLKEHAITIQAFAIGSKFRGLIGIVAFYVAATGDSQPVAEEPFQVNSAELPENTERRFLPWLERSLARALTLCRQSL
jgi:hypothetical protein